MADFEETGRTKEPGIEQNSKESEVKEKSASERLAEKVSAAKKGVLEAKQAAVKAAAAQIESGIGSIVKEGPERDQAVSALAQEVVPIQNRMKEVVAETEHKVEGVMTEGGSTVPEISAAEVRSQAEYAVGQIVTKEFEREGKSIIAECEVIDQYAPEYDEMLRGKPLWRKSGEFKIRKAEAGEKIVTKQGATERTADEDSYVVEQSTGESFIITGDDLKKRYDPKKGEEGVYLAKGVVRGASLTKNILLKASWGEFQGGLADRGDMFAQRLDTGERYCIEGEAIRAYWRQLNDEEAEQYIKSLKPSQEQA